MPELAVQLAPELAEVLVAVAEAGDAGLDLQVGDDSFEPGAVGQAQTLGLVAVGVPWGGQSLVDRLILLTPTGRSMVKSTTDDGRFRQEHYPAFERLRPGELVSAPPPGDPDLTCTVTDSLGNKAAGVSIAHAQHKLDLIHEAFDLDRAATATEKGRTL